MVAFRTSFYVTSLLPDVFCLLSQQGQNESQLGQAAVIFSPSRQQIYGTA